MKNNSEERRNFGSVFRLHRCCATNRDERQFARYIHFRDGYAYASDAHILVRADIATISYNLFDEEEIAHLNGKAIHADCFKQLLQESFVTIDQQGFHAKDDEGNEIIYCTRDLSAPDPETGEATVRVPDFAKIFDELGERKETDALGLNSKYLERLVDAMGGDGAVRIDMNGTKAMRVTHISTQGIDDIQGVLMPIWFNRDDEVITPDNDPQTDIVFPTITTTDEG